jgi:hypothetical protein
MVSGHPWRLFQLQQALPPLLSFPHTLRIDSFLHWGWTGRQTCPEDVYIPHRGAYQPFVGLHVNALQGGHLSINSGLDDGGTRRAGGIIADGGGDTPLFQGPEVCEDPEVKRHPVLGHLLVGHTIGHALQVAQRFGVLGADFPQLPEGATMKPVYRKDKETLSVCYNANHEGTD